MAPSLMFCPLNPNLNVPAPLMSLSQFIKEFRGYLVFCPVMGHGHLLAEVQG